MIKYYPRDYLNSIYQKRTTDGLQKKYDIKYNYKKTKKDYS